MNIKIDQDEDIPISSIRENDGLTIEKLVYVLVGTVTLAFNIVIFTTLRRTRRIPYASKLLSSGLLVFDMAFILTVVSRELISNAEVIMELHAHIASMLMLQSAYTTVALMSLERYIILQWPMRYLQYGTKSRIRKLVFTVWTTELTIFLLCRFGMCGALYDYEKAFTVSATCNKVVTVFYIVLISSALFTSYVCYIQIFKIIKKQVGQKDLSIVSAANVLRQSKSTSIVLCYIFVISVTSFGYLLMIIFIRRFNLDVKWIRHGTDIIHYFNCLLNPFLYVLWFRESRMECLKILAPFSRRIRNKVEAMRIDVFNIVLKDQIKTSKIMPALAMDNPGYLNNELQKKQVFDVESI